MRRFASHYLFIPGSGFYKQYVVELSGNRVERIYPLVSEIDHVSWMPGVMVLIPCDGTAVNIDSIARSMKLNPNKSTDKEVQIPDQESNLYLLTTFDFDSMCPGAGCRMVKL